LFVKGEEIKSISLISASGQLLESYSVNSLETELDLHAYETGLYVLEITWRKGQRKHYKVLKSFD
jgi:hypothetical protein